MRRIIKRIILVVVIVIGVAIGVSALTVFAVNKYTSKPDFCVLCHLMKHPYDTWKVDEHGKRGINCTMCHFVPDKRTDPVASVITLGELFTHLGTGKAGKRGLIKDKGCMTSDCHPKEGFWTKKINYTGKYRRDYNGTLREFVHEIHEEKTLEGQKLHCQSCHITFSAERHFEVPKEVCFLCHFKNEEINEGRGKCSICHLQPSGMAFFTGVLRERLEKVEKIPTTESPENFLTHERLEKAKVPCASCHFDTIEGNGYIKDDACASCHYEPTDKLWEHIESIEHMHDAHVTKQKARCFNCHEVITHHKPLDFDHRVISNCTICHPEPHYHQKMLQSGMGGKGIDTPYPIGHYGARANCLSCHTKDGYDQKGRKVRRADVKNCTQCHGEDRETYAKQWKESIEEEIKVAREIEREVIKAIEDAKGKVPEDTIKKVKAMLRDGQDNIILVDAGGGLHNKKYSMLLIETATDLFYEAIEELKKNRKKLEGN